jgi:hypothetical protein
MAGIIPDFQPADGATTVQYRKRRDRMFEHHQQPHASTSVFVRRMARFILTAMGILSASLVLGIFGYHYFEGLSWLDSLLNASMLLGGMGPLAPLHTVAGKLFASFYALYSGMIILVAAGVMVTPILHRVLHHFHLEIEEKDN